MNPTRLFTQDVVIAHKTPDPSTPDEFGNPGTTTTTQTVDGELQQIRRAEETGSGDVQNETRDLFVEPTATLAGADSISIDGEPYELIGPPWRARNPRTREYTHIEATVRRTT